MLILGIDGGLRNIGFCLCRDRHILMARTIVLPRCPELDALDDCMARSSQALQELGQAIDHYKPDLIAIEKLSLPRGRGIWKIAFCWAQMRLFCSLRGLSCVEIAPQRIRRLLGVRPGASKKRLTTKTWQATESGAEKLLDIPVGRRQHAIDAASVALAAAIAIAREE